MQFEFSTVNRIVFGEGSIREISSQSDKIGQCTLVITGKSEKRAAPLLEILDKLGKKIEKYNVQHEPTTDLVIQCADKAKTAGCNSVIGIGGGSVIDTGKAVAALITNEGNLIDYLEVVGEGKPLYNPPVPYIALPTTAGTGTEVTRNAVIKSTEHNVKVSLRGEYVLPYMAIVDPELTYSMPPDITASTGLDAITQLIEAYVSNKANPLTDGLCCEGLRLAARSIRLAYQDGNNRKAREDMCIASLFSGIALANAKLGAVHGFAGPIGGMFDAPHGVICARLLPYVMETNVIGLCKIDKNHPILLKYKNLSRIITENASAKVEDGIEFIKNLCNDLKFNKLPQYGITVEHFSSIADKAEKASSMKGNPIKLNKDELKEILRKSVR